MSDGPAPQPPAVTPEPKPWSIVTRQQLGALMGVHPDTVTDYVRAGMPVVTRGGRGKESEYDALKCLAWWREQLGTNKKETAQARQLTATAELNELKLAQQRGDLWPRDAILLAGQTIVKTWSSAIRGLPRRMVKAGVVNREREADVAALCRDLLTEISEWKPPVIKPAGGKRMPV
jgi:hypothetical protein